MARKERKRRLQVSLAAQAAAWPAVLGAHSVAQTPLVVGSAVPGAQFVPHTPLLGLRSVVPSHASLCLRGSYTLITSGGQPDNRPILLFVPYGRPQETLLGLFRLALPLWLPILSRTRRTRNRFLVHRSADSVSGVRFLGLAANPTRCRLLTSRVAAPTV